MNPENMTKARLVAERFLEQQKGYEINDRGWSSPAGSVDFIATDADGTLRFIDVASDVRKLPAVPTIDNEYRARAEAIAMAYLSQHDGSECSVTFDYLGIGFLDNNRAFLKMYANMLCAA